MNRLQSLQKFEDALARVEAKILTVLVLLMLGLAVYNVIYRNVLVPVQFWADQGANADVAKTESKEAAKEVEPDLSTPSTETNNSDEEFGGGFGGEEEGEDDEFGGGFGSEKETEEAPKKEENSDEGFGGGFGDPNPPPPSDDEGFGGGFGDPEPTEEPKKSDEGFGGGFGSTEDAGVGGGGDAGESFGGGFGDSPDSDDDPIEEQAYVEPIQSTTGAVIQAMKLEWIDVLLRHLVLVVGFLGAMLATRRRKHITVDALSKVIKGKTLIATTLATTTLSIVVCIFLGLAGMDLVSLGLEFPKELAWWADEWHMQLVFPVGFFMLAFHFGVRAVEEAVALKTGDDSFLRDEVAEAAVGPPSSDLEEEE